MMQFAEWLCGQGEQDYWVWQEAGYGSDERAPETTVKTFSRKDGHIWLLPANPDYQPINGDNCEILGKVTAVLRSVR